MNAKDVLNYLKVALEMETNRFMAQELLDKIRQLMSSLGKPETIAAPQKPVRKEDNMSLGDGCQMGAVFIVGLLVGVIFIAGIIFDSWSKKWLWLAIPALLFALLAFFGLVGDSVSNDRAFKKEWKEYQKELNSYQKLIDEDSKRLEDEKAKIEELRVVENNIIAYIGNVTHRLEQYYRIGILHPKYQNFIAVSSIYEYMETGICDRLSGQGGAYDTFETLSRMDKIITNMDDVKNLLHSINGSLQDVKNNQFVLYQAIESSNQQINDLSTELKNQLTTINRQNQQEIRQLKISNYLSLKENMEIKEMNKELTRIREIQARMES